MIKGFVFSYVCWLLTLTVTPDIFGPPDFLQPLKDVAWATWIYNTSSNDTSSIEPFRRKGFLSKCHFVECPLRQNRFSSNIFDKIL